MILLSCKSRPVKKDPPDVSTTSDFFDMKINPNSRNTLIMWIQFGNFKIVIIIRIELLLKNLSLK